VTTGAEVSYFLDETLGGPDLSEVSARWYCINDTQFAPSKPKYVPGPKGTEWKDATWSFPGHHHIVCEVTLNGKTTAYRYEQWVIPISAELQGGPIRPQLKEDPAATLDWTNPMVRGTTGEYSGFGASSKEALEDAFKAWDAHNRYPTGGITYKTPKILDAPELSGNFETDGTARWDSIAAFFGWVGLGSAALAGVVTLLAPVPGSQIVSAAIWTSIFSSTAAATINIGTRVEEGFSSWQANAFDVLSIVGNLFGAAAIVWSRGANLIVQTANGPVKYALMGAVGTDVVQGVMLAGEYIDQYDAIEADPNLPPDERTMKLVRLFAEALADGLLVYISVKGTKSDLENLSAKGLSGKSVAQQVEELKDPNKTIDTRPPAKVEGVGGKNQKTKVNIDPEMETPHAWASPKKVPRKSLSEEFKDAMGHGHHAKVAKDVPALRAQHPELAH
jgi:hypothetical protein